MDNSSHYNPLRDRQITFEPLALTIKGEDTQVVGYDVYVDEKQFYRVAAQTVAEALLKSGVEKPLKVEATNIKNQTLF